MDADGAARLTQNLVSDPAELPEPLGKLEHDPGLALGIAQESPARMAAAFAVFGSHGTYHDLAMALSVTVNGQPVWTLTPHGTPALSPLAVRMLSVKELRLGFQQPPRAAGSRASAGCPAPSAAIAAPGTPPCPAARSPRSPCGTPSPAPTA